MDATKDETDGGGKERIRFTQIRGFVAFYLGIRVTGHRKS